jgi:hypothetical protein
LPILGDFLAVAASGSGSLSIDSMLDRNLERSRIEQPA